MNKLAELFFKHKVPKKGKGKVRFAQCENSCFFFGKCLPTNVIFTSFDTLLEVLASFDLPPSRIARHRRGEEIPHFGDFHPVEIDFGNIRAVNATASRLMKYITRKGCQLVRPQNALEFGTSAWIFSPGQASLKLHWGDAAAIVSRRHDLAVGDTGDAEPPYLLSLPEFARDYDYVMDEQELVLEVEDMAQLLLKQVPMLAQQRFHCAVFSIDKSRTNPEAYVTQCQECVDAKTRCAGAPQAPA